jgi:hypothetical protein
MMTEALAGTATTAGIGVTTAAAEGVVLAAERRED